MSVITLEKELYGWNIKDIGRIIREEFISILPEQFRFIVKDVKDFTPSESYGFSVDEVFDEDTLTNYVRDYVHNSEDRSFLGHILGIDDDFGWFNIYVVTTFQPRWDNETKLPQEGEDGRNHDNRVLYIALTDEDGEGLFTINFTK